MPSGTTPSISMRDMERTLVAPLPVSSIDTETEANDTEVTQIQRGRKRRRDRIEMVTLSFLLGNCNDPVLASYNGAAPLSKLAFVDIGDSRIVTREITLPSSLTKYIYQPVYDVGARIHAEAWGGTEKRKRR
jgi:hypothetical protein